MTSDGADSTRQITHPMWEDISEETGNEHHWHHREPEDGYQSIRLSNESTEGLGAARNGWTVELYPDPDNDGHMTRWHFPSEEYDRPSESAREQVGRIMESHA